MYSIWVGMVVVCSPRDGDKFIKSIPEAGIIGEVVKQRGEERVILDQMKNRTTGGRIESYY